MEPPEIAGALIVNPRGQIVVIRPGNGDWTLPKRLVERGETLYRTALRAVAECTGITDVTVVAGTPAVPGMRPTGVHRVAVHILTFTTTQERLLPRDQQQMAACWIGFDEAFQVVRNPADAHRLATAWEAIVHLRRHAERPARARRRGF